MLDIFCCEPYTAGMAAHQITEFSRIVERMTGLDCTPTILRHMEAEQVLQIPERSNQSKAGNRLYYDEVQLPRACLALILRHAELGYDRIRQVFDQLDARPETEAEVLWAAILKRARATDAVQLFELRIARVIAQDLVSWAENGGGNTAQAGRSQPTGGELS